MWRGRRNETRRARPSGLAGVLSSSTFSFLTTLAKPQFERLTLRHRVVGSCWPALAFYVTSYRSRPKPCLLLATFPRATSGTISSPPQLHHVLLTPPLHLKTIPYSPAPLFISLDVHLPPFPTASPSPVLLFIHGGGCLSWARTHFPLLWLLDLCEEKGWVFVTTDYRLLVGGATKDGNGVDLGKAGGGRRR